MYAGYARSDQEIENALKLATETFQKNQTDKTLHYKRLLMFPDRDYSLQNVIVVVTDKGELCGACFLHDRTFYRGRYLLKGTFLSSICIAPSFRERGLSKLLMNTAIAACGQRNSSFALVIARRDVDYFYNQFFFWGLSQYNTIQIKYKNECIENCGYLKNADRPELKTINRLYKKVYSNMNGACMRSSRDWEHILWKVEEQRFQFVVYKIEEEIKGYLIYYKNNIYELAVQKNNYYLGLLNTLRKKNPNEEFILNVSKNHPIRTVLEKFDFFLTERQCYYGGHMVRIIRKDELVKCLKEEIKERINFFGIEKYREKYQDTVIEFYNGQVNIKLPHSSQDFHNTCFLMGVPCLSSVDEVSIYAPNPFNILRMDEV